MIGTGQRARVDPLALALAAGPFGGLARRCRRLRRLGQQHQAHRQRLEAAVRLAHQHREVDAALTVSPLAQRQPVQRLAIVAGQRQAVPGQAHQHLGPAGQGIAQPIRLRIATLADQEADPGARQQIQPLADLGGGDPRRDAALARRVPLQMQPIVRARAGRLDEAGVDEGDRTRGLAQSSTGQADLLGAQRLQPVRRMPDPLHQGDVGEVAQPAFGRQRRGRTQRQAAGAIGQDKAKQIDRGLDFARAGECAMGAG